MSFRSMLPSVKAQEAELVDPQTTLREKCGESGHCKGYKEKLESCNARVNSRTNTQEVCSDELIDFMHCIDHCAAKTLFNILK